MDLGLIMSVCLRWLQTGTCGICTLGCVKGGAVGKGPKESGYYPSLGFDYRYP